MQISPVEFCFFFRTLGLPRCVFRPHQSVCFWSETTESFGKVVHRPVPQGLEKLKSNGAVIYVEIVFVVSLNLKSAGTYLDFVSCDLVVSAMCR